MGLFYFIHCFEHFYFNHQCCPEKVFSMSMSCLNGKFTSQCFFETILSFNTSQRISVLLLKYLMLHDLSVNANEILRPLPHVPTSARAREMPYLCPPPPLHFGWHCPGGDAQVTQGDAVIAAVLINALRTEKGT